MAQDFAYGSSPVMVQRYVDQYQEKPNQAKDMRGNQDNSCDQAVASDLEHQPLAQRHFSGRDKHKEQCATTYEYRSNQNVKKVHQAVFKQPPRKVTHGALLCLFDFIKGFRLEETQQSRMLPKKDAR